MVTGNSLTMINSIGKIYNPDAVIIVSVKILISSQKFCLFLQKQLYFH